MVCFLQNMKQKSEIMRIQNEKQVKTYDFYKIQINYYIMFYSKIHKFSVQSRNKRYLINNTKYYFNAHIRWYTAVVYKIISITYFFFLLFFIYCHHYFHLFSSYLHSLITSFSFALPLYLYQQFYYLYYCTINLFLYFYCFCRFDFFSRIYCLYNSHFYCFCDFIIFVGLFVFLSFK